MLVVYIGHVRIALSSFKGICIQTDVHTKSNAYQLKCETLPHTAWSPFLLVHCVLHCLPPHEKNCFEHNIMRKQRRSSAVR